MIYLLDVASACSSPALANILSILKQILSLIQLIGPILGIVGLAICFSRLMANPEEKKNKSALKNCLIATALLFFIPFLVNLTMGLLDDSFELATCWNNAESVKNTGEKSEYNNSKDKDHQSIIVTPDAYENNGESNAQNNRENAGQNNNQNNSGSTTQTGSLVFIGDSRTVGMKSAVSGEADDWSCKSSMGLDWMKTTGVPNITSQIKTNSKVIILMGVNDLYQAASYIEYLNSMSATWQNKGAKTYFVSVNPTDKTYNYLNSQIDEFNQKLKSGLHSRITYIDSNSYLKSAGYTTTDGLHYNNKTYQKIYNYIKNHV